MKALSNISQIHDYKPEDNYLPQVPSQYNFHIHTV